MFEEWWNNTITLETQLGDHTSPSGRHSIRKQFYWYNKMPSMLSIAINNIRKENRKQSNHTQRKHSHNSVGRSRRRSLLPSRQGNKEATNALKGKMTVRFQEEQSSTSLEEISEKLSVSSTSIFTPTTDSSDKSELIKRLLKGQPLCTKPNTNHRYTSFNPISKRILLLDLIHFQSSLLS